MGVQMVYGNTARVNVPVIGEPLERVVPDYGRNERQDYCGN